jgi:hypothetical protein
MGSSFELFKKLTCTLINYTVGFTGGQTVGRKDTKVTKKSSYERFVASRLCACPGRQVRLSGRQVKLLIPEE